jgi:1-acyl-sn-glycerol-3-phosphate acyltransferase
MDMTTNDFKTGAHKKPFGAGFVTEAIKQIIRIFCRIDDSQLRKVPQKGPLIIVSNHINFLEVPLLYTHLLPRSMTGFAKVEGWKNPFLRYLAISWNAIPLHRGEADRPAIRKALAALNDGLIMGIAPEGTRSGDGQLQRGHPGIVILALISGAPMLPLVHFGGEKYRENLTKFRRTDFHIAVGSPFTLSTKNKRSSNEIRQQITDEIMYQIAACLPSSYRGEYSDFSKASENYLDFPRNSESNLKNWNSSFKE